MTYTDKHFQLEDVEVLRNLSRKKKSSLEMQQTLQKRPDQLYPSVKKTYRYWMIGFFLGIIGFKFSRIFLARLAGTDQARHAVFLQKLSGSCEEY